MRKNTLLVSVILGLTLFPCICSSISESKNIGLTTAAQQNNEFFYTYEQFTELLATIRIQYPDIFSYYSLTQTYECRQVWCIKISKNVLLNESEPQILFMGGVHGNERPGFQTVIYSLCAIVENYTNPRVNDSFTLRIRDIVNSTELFFIPMVNPDGIHAFTRKNCNPNCCVFGNTLFRGVDLNRNYDYNWDDANKHPLRYVVIPRTWEQLKILFSRNTNNYLFERTAVRLPLLDFGSIVGLGLYRGPEAFSENESAAMRTFIEEHHVTISVDYHTYGEKIFYPQPWRYNNLKDNSTFRSLVENISKINGYDCSRRINWSNLSGTYPLWAYVTHDVFPLTIELCNSSEQNQKPDKPYLLQLFYTHLLVNLYLAEKAIISQSFKRED